MIKSKNNNHMYNQADASNAWATDTLKELFDVFFLTWAPYPMIHLIVFINHCEPQETFSILLDCLISGD